MNCSIEAVSIIANSSGICRIHSIRGILNNQLELVVQQNDQLLLRSNALKREFSKILVRNVKDSMRISDVCPRCYDVEYVASFSTVVSELKFDVGSPIRFLRSSVVSRNDK